MIKLFYSFALATIILACSKERLDKLDPSQVNPPAATVTFITPDGNTDIFESLQPDVQQITLTDDDDLPIIGKFGTELYIYPEDFTTPNGGAVDYPITVEFVEVLTPKDFILNNLQTISNGKLLETAGSFYVNALKGNQQLITRIGVSIARQTNNPDFDMQLFSLEFSDTDSSSINWVLTDTTRQGRNIFINERPNEEIETYVTFPPNLGWWNIDKFLNSDQETTEITFSSSTPSLEQLRAYLFFYEFNSIMQISNSKSVPLPIGAKVRMLAFAKTETGEFYGEFKDLTITKNQTVEIKVTPTTEAIIQQELDNLTFRSEN